MFDGSVRIYPVFSCEKMSQEIIKKIIFYPEKQHLKTPPLFRHFLANLLNSPLRQFFQPLVGSHTFPAPGTRETKSNPYVSFKILAPLDVGNLNNHITKGKYLPLFLSFVMSFHPWGSSKLKKYYNTNIIHHSEERMWNC